MNGENGHGSKVLIGKKAIMDYLDLKHEQTFYKWIERGMPALCEDKRWVAHKENIDNYFKVTTNVMNNEVPEDTE
jgi:hypothetical protein